jgi:hypothetical protein
MNRMARRGALRVPCRVPVAVLGPKGRLEALVEDMSRTGLRMRIPRSVLTLPALPTLGQVAITLSRAFPEEAWCTFDPARLGDRVRRRTRVVRIVRPLGMNEDLQVGCTLRTPLGEEEGHLLGLTLPAEGDAPEAPSAPAGRGGTAAADGGESRPAERGTAVVISRNGTRKEPFEARLESVAEDGVVLRVSTVSDVGLPPVGGDVTASIAAFTDAYGSEMLVRLRSDGREFWEGPVRLENAEVVEERPSELRLGFAFTEALWPWEREALSLGGSAR